VTDLPRVSIFSDGACAGNPGPGGWAAILRDEGTGREVRISGAEEDATNNRMELTAAIRGLEMLKKPCRVQVVSDSQYLVKGLNEWLDRWRRKNWHTTAGPVRNRDLWERLAELKGTHQITCHWIAGHAGHLENEECDRMAREALEKL